MMKIRNLILRRQKGIGLLELMLSLAVIAILLVMATRYYLTTSLASDVNQVVSDIQGMTSCVENWKQAYIPKIKSSLSDFALGDCVENGWFPETRTTGGTNPTLLTPWGTDSTITPSDKDIQLTIKTNTLEQAKTLAAKLGGDPTKISAKQVVYNLLAQTLGQ